MAWRFLSGRGCGIRYRGKGSVLKEKKHPHWDFFEFHRENNSKSPWSGSGDRVLLVCNTHRNLSNCGFRLQRLKSGYHVLESEFLRDDGLDGMRGGKGGEFGDGVARESGLAADW
jgi:hypothetical protein